MNVTAEKSRGHVGRPRSFDEEEALDKAMRVFWEKGYEGASLQLLTTAMGIRPASLYAVFGNKERLFTQVLARYRASQVPFVQDALKESSAFAVAEKLLRDTAVFLTRPSFPHGCLTIQTSLAASDEAQGVHNDLISLRINAERALRQRFARAKKEGDLPDSADPASLARFVTTLYQGMTVQGVNGATRRELLDLVRTGLEAWPKAS